MNRNGAVSSGQEASLPERFTWPFRYFPHRTVREAAARLTGHIDSDGRLKEIFSEGKMLGVLVVRAGKASGASSGKDRHGMQADRDLLHRLPGNSPLCGEDDIFYLAAFSGNAGGHNMLPGFVPPVFDILDPDGHFKNEERKISAITDEIGRLSAMPGMPPADERIMQLKEKRNRMSEELQEWLFRQYVVTNGEGEEKSILDIFADKGLVPPGGTGECAAPKLLHYALSHSLKPVAMGEFWYCGENEDKGTGKGNDSAVREKGRFYPSCSGKCGPLLRWMLTGVDTDNPYDFDDATVPEILWQDDSIMAVSKPAGMLCVPGRDGQKSLIERLPGPCFQVHRLDMDTSGVLLVAKTLRAQSCLRRQFEERMVDKTYTAIVENRTGLRKGDSGTIDIPLRPDIRDRPRQIADSTYGKRAITGYTVREVMEGPSGTHLAEVEFRPLTGRTHQIRVHAATGLGCPVLGDLLYGGPYYRRLCLHAESIRFRHPVTGEEMEFTDGEPDFLRMTACKKGD